MGKVLLFFFSLLSKIVEKLFEVNLDTKGEGGPRGVGGGTMHSSTALPSNAELRAEGQNHCPCAINNAGQVFGFFGSIA